MEAVTRLPKKSRVIRLIASFTALRNAVALTFGLGTDESHYVLYAKFLGLSYFDYPPLVGWIQALLFSSSSSTIIFIGVMSPRDEVPGSTGCRPDGNLPAQREGWYCWFRVVQVLWRIKIRKRIQLMNHGRKLPSMQICSLSYWPIAL